MSQLLKKNATKNGNIHCQEKISKSENDRFGNYIYICFESIVEAITTQNIYVRPCIKIFVSIQTLMSIDKISQEKSIIKEREILKNDRSDLSIYKVCDDILVKTIL